MLRITFFTSKIMRKKLGFFPSAIKGLTFKVVLQKEKDKLEYNVTLNIFNYKCCL